MLIQPKDDVDMIWKSIKQGDTYKTPDRSRGVAFTIDHIEDDQIHILPQKIDIRKKAFIATLEYLQAENYTTVHRCEIKSNNDMKKAGPLCQASRRENNGVRCINYIVPILKEYGIVDCDGDRPNTVWLKR